MSVDSLNPGARARLTEVGGERPFRRRLMELGLLPGTPVRLVRRSDVGGVLEMEVRGCRISVRRREAELIQIEQLG